MRVHAYVCICVGWHVCPPPCFFFFFYFHRQKASVGKHHSCQPKFGKIVFSTKTLLFVVAVLYTKSKGQSEACSAAERPGTCKKKYQLSPSLTHFFFVV